MGTDSKIEWTDHTLNFWAGCTKVSAACDHCYMYRDAKRRGFDPSVVKRTSAATWRQPLVKARATGEYKWKPRARIFVCSWSDFFHKDADEWRHEAFTFMMERPDLIWIILSKRPERAAGFLADYSPSIIRTVIPNLYLGVTVENNDQRWRIEELLKLRAYAKVLFVSAEPLLGELDLRLDERITCPNCGSESKFAWSADDHDDPTVETAFCINCNANSYEGKYSWDDFCKPHLDWVIAGGESGPGARPSHPDWVRKIRDDCQAAATPFFFKQWGEWGLPKSLGAWDDSLEAGEVGLYRDGPVRLEESGGWGKRCAGELYPRDLSTSRYHKFEDGQEMLKIGKKKASNLLDGVKYEEWPE